MTRQLAMSPQRRINPSPRQSSPTRSQHSPTRDYSSPAREKTASPNSLHWASVNDDPFFEIDNAPDNHDEPATILTGVDDGDMSFKKIREVSL